MAPGYSTWTLEQLKKESQKIERAIKTKESEEKKVVVSQIKALAKKHGYELSELVAEAIGPTKAKNSSSTATKKSISPNKVASSASGKPKKRAKAKIKYRNPSNASDTWSGRGRKPKWVVLHLSQGGSLVQLSV